MTIKDKIKWMITRYLPQYSYSQDGEDMVLKTFLNKDKGYYVDVGAHHPIRFSNTAYFYKKGWNGINIEPTPILIKDFQRYRKRDVNLNLGITNQASEFTFYMFSDSALNSFDKELSLERHEKSPYKIVKEKKIKTCRLSDILDKYLPQNQKIDFFSIDVEGFDLDVLKSNDWEKYIPDFIVIETLSEFSLEKMKEDKIYNYLTEQHYKLVARTCITSIFKKIG
jgi:FkbM family methyltransferase